MSNAVWPLTDRKQKSPHHWVTIHRHKGVLR